MKRIIHYLQGHYQVDPNTSTTIIVTLLIFAVGYLISSVASLIKMLWKRKSYQNGLLLILHGFQKSCRVQGITLSKSLKLFGFEEGKSIRIDYITIAALEHLDKVEFGEAISNFVGIFNRKLTSHSITRLFGIVHHIKHLNDQLLVIGNTYSPLFQKYQDDYQNNLGMIRNLHDQLITELSNNEIQDELTKEFFFKFNEIFSEWKKLKLSPEIYYTCKHVISPLRELCKEFIEVKYTHVLTDWALKADLAFINLEEISIQMKERYSHTAKKHLDASRIIQLLISILEAWCVANIWSKKPLWKS